MTNFLEGIEFRALKSSMPTWNKDNYTEWADANGDMVFASGTQFRVKPKYTYEVSSRDSDPLEPKKELATPVKDNAMKCVARLVEEGKTVKIEKLEASSLPLHSFLAERNIQFRAIGADKWAHPNYLNTSVLTSRTEFRVRPDTYFEVSVKNGISQSTLTFDDVDKLDDYVSKQLRTSQNNIVITRRAYGNTQFLQF